MPNMANITVKNAAGTDVVYVASTPSAGDKSPARWTQNAASGVQGFRPTFTLLSQDNGAGDVRRLEGVLTFPVTYTDTATSLQRMLASVKVNAVVFLPKSLTTDQWNEAFVQAGNLLASALIRSAVQEGYAPN